MPAGGGGWHPGGVGGSAGDVEVGTLRGLQTARRCQRTALAARQPHREPQPPADEDRAGRKFISFHSKLIASSPGQIAGKIHFKIIQLHELS